MVQHLKSAKVSRINSAVGAGLAPPANVKFVSRAGQYRGTVCQGTVSTVPNQEHHKHGFSR
jgi:hypothetical protein